MAASVGPTTQAEGLPITTSRCLIHGAQADHSTYECELVKQWVAMQVAPTDNTKIAEANAVGFALEGKWKSELWMT